uniref:Uncharacterized protein n=1 Tax=Rhizophora mucronata TaxID=61149 RepID=A0A2P2NZ80_RHIMU
MQNWKSLNFPVERSPEPSVFMLRRILCCQAQPFCLMFYDSLQSLANNAAILCH